MKDDKVCELVDLSPNGKIVGHKWLFKKKTNMDGAVHTYKARLVAKGFTQTLGIDYEETFSLVVYIGAVRILIAIDAFYEYEIWKIDVKTALLKGYLNEKHMQNIPYASAVGSIMYVVRCTRPDVAFAQNITSQFQQNDGDTKQELRVSCYTDARYLTDVDDIRLDMIGVVTIIKEPIHMYCDNIGAKIITKDHGVTKGARHFRAKVHYLRETIEMGDVKIEKVNTDDNLTDPFTKALAFLKHSELTEKIGMIPASVANYQYICKPATPTPKWELLEYEQTDGEEMINSIKNGDQPLPRVTQVSIARTSSTEQHPLKDKSMWSDQEKKIQKIDRLARSLLIQGLPNDIYSLIDSNKTPKDLWDALARHMLGFEYGEQDRKAAVLYEYEIFKATQNQGDVNDAMKSKKKAVVITSDPLALVAEQTKMSKRKEKVIVSSESKGTTSSANKKQEYVKSDDKKEEKKVDEKKRDMSKVKCYNCKKEGYFSKDFKKAKVKDYEYYKTKMLLAKKDKDEQVLLAEDHAWMESSSDSDQEINANMVFMAQIRKVLSNSEASSSSSNDKITEKKIIECLKSNGFESSEHAISESKNQSEDDCQVVEKEYDNLENLNVIAPGMFKLSVSQSVSSISVTKTSCASNSVETKLKRKRRKGTSSKHNVNQVNSVVSRVNKDSVHFSDLDTFNSVRRPKPSDFIWKKKGSSNTVKDNLSYVHHSNLNKNVKRYSHKDLMLCNNSQSRDTRSAHACNNDRNAYCNSYDVDVNDLFVFNDVSLRQYYVSKMPFKKKPSASLNVPSRSKLNKSLPRIVRKRLLKLQPLAEPIAKWISKIVQICLWIIDSGCSKHMTGNRALLTNFMKKFLEMVRFGNNDFVVIAGYGDVVIRSMTIKKVYYVEGLGHNLFSVGQFCDKGIKVSFRKSTCFVRNEGGVDILTGDRSSNLYTIALNEVASNSSACLLAKDSSSQSWLWHQQLLKKIAARTPQQNGVVERRNRTLVEAARTMLTFANLPLFLWAEAIATACFTQNRSIIHKRFDKTLYVLMNKRKPNIKFFHVFGFRCYLLNDYDDVRKLKAKGDIGVFVRYSKESAVFRVYNKRTHKIHESVNVNFNELSEMASKQFSLEPGLSNLNETGKSSNPSVSQVSETSKKDLEDLYHNFYDEYFDSSKIMKSSRMNVETSNIEIPSQEKEVFS
uniref:Retrovirus-related Pol polyprotein from transposon TNT 1-94 n=1 Tax=Tanacetum cinerariifolium TaxID=118510 RepID=A0A6L2K084_TANCI|nr:retrovirus-related Pol polyprotein from transposon TNT 1-94 [Tanacetum cinerariifolium]